MTDSKAIERHITKMIVLGGRFQLGDLYDYRNDTTLTDGRKCWESTDVASSTQVDNQFKLKCKLPDSESTNNKWDNMGLDEHLKASVLAGLVNKYRGACNYLNDQPNPSQATRILICRAKSRKEHLDLQTLVNEDVLLRLPSGEEKTQKPGSVPTHVVVGVIYGAEAYCVLTQDFNVSDEVDEDAREEAEENLTRIARKMEDALNDKQEPNEFAGQFDKDEKKQLTRMKCRLYADLSSSSVRECNVLEAYKHCLKLIDQVQKTDIEKCKAVPIAVLLCPLKFVMGKTGGVPYEYQDVDSDQIARCGRFWDELERVSTRIGTFRSKKGSRVSLRPFEDAIGKYKDLVKKSLKNAVVKARETGDEEEIEKIAKIMETHPLFKPTRLERWLRFKEAESEMAGKITGVSRPITFFANKKMLVKELAESFDKKYALVLSVPPLDEKTSKILLAMKEYLDNYTKLVSVEQD